MKKQRNGAVPGKWAAGWIGFLTAVFFFLWAGSFSELTVLAADSSVIEKLTITFKTTFGEAEEIPDPVITVSGSGCSLGDVQYSKEYDQWKPGKKVRVEVNVVADSGKVFPRTLNRSDCKVSGADFVSAKALDDTTMQVKVDYKPITVLGNTSEAGWSSSTSRKAVWEKVEYAPGYTVVLYGDNKVVKRLNVKTNSANLASYMTDEDLTYYYEVKAVPLTSDEKKYLKEGDFVTSEDTVVEIDYDDEDDSDNGPGRGAGDGGTVRGNTYVFPDGQLARNSWKQVSGKWYYYDQNGYMTRGWIAVGGCWYYMDGNGVMTTGWANPGDGWFYLGEDGSMRTGWIQPVPGKWYYLNQSGYMESGWAFINGRWFYLGADGAMVTGWAFVNQKWYYLDSDGAMRTGWVNLNGLWYYLYADGSMAENITIDGWEIALGGVASKAGA